MVSYSCLPTRFFLLLLSMYLLKKNPFSDTHNKYKNLKQTLNETVFRKCFIQLTNIIINKSLKLLYDKYGKFQQISNMKH